MRLNHALRSPGRDDDGFTLTEAVVATGIILILVAGFTTFMTRMLAAQSALRAQTVASRVMHDEVERLAAITWDDLMYAGEGACTLDTERRSAAVINPNTSTVTADGATIYIDRSLTWDGSGDSIECTNSGKDRDDMKNVTVRVRWADPRSGEFKEQQVVMLRSRHVQEAESSDYEEITRTDTPEPYMPN